jgi:hypothetical protein
VTAPAGMTGPYLALRHAFAISTDDDEFARLVTGALRDLEQPGLDAACRYDVTTGGDGLRVRVDDTDLAVDVTGHEALRWIVWHVNQAAVASCPDCVLLHATAAVINGVTFVCGGESGAGKSTLAAGLLRGDAVYITDEAVAIDESTLEVLPFPKPLSLHPGSWHLLPASIEPPGGDEALVPASSIGAVMQDRAGRPGALATVRHTPGAGQPPQPISRAEMVFRLAGLTFGFTSDVTRHLRCLAALVTSAACFVIDSDDTAETVAQLGATIRAGSEAARQPVPLMRDDDGLLAVDLDQEAVVFVWSTGSLHHLDPLAMHVWSALREGRSLSQMVDDLSEMFSEPRERIQADVHQLAARLRNDELIPA